MKGHGWTNGICSVCGEHCDHEWHDGVCENCQMVCDHHDVTHFDGSGDLCSICGQWIYDD